MQTHQLDKRIRKMLEVLDEFTVIQSAPVEQIQIAPRGSDAWAAFKNGDFWGTPEEEWFDFRFAAVTPEGFCGRTVLSIKTGRESEWEAVNPQILVWVDGRIELRTVDGIRLVSYLVKNGGGEVSRTVTMLDGVSVVEVPASLMKTAYNFESGWAASDDAAQIQMLLIHPEAVITPVSYEFACLDQPSAATGGKYAYYEESFEDVFVLEKRVDGISFVIGA